MAIDVLLFNFQCSLKFVPMSVINKQPILFPTIGDKTISELMMVFFTDPMIKPWIFHAISRLPFRNSMLFNELRISAGS